LSVIQLFGRLSFAGAVPATSHSTGGRFGISLVPRYAHVASPVVCRASPTGGAS
jgi:hypothetical protein